MTWDAMAVVGRIARPHGIRGQVVVNLETDFPHERFQPGAAFYVNRSVMERPEVRSLPATTAGDSLPPSREALRRTAVALAEAGKPSRPTDAINGVRYEQKRRGNLTGVDWPASEEAPCE